MIIVSKDCKILYENTCYTVYVLKTSKEIKGEISGPETEVEKYKPYGYYTCVKNAFRGVSRWRNSKKYPFTESKKEFNNYYLELKFAENKLTDFINSLDTPILEFYNKFIKHLQKHV